MVFNTVLCLNVKLSMYGFEGKERVNSQQHALALMTDWNFYFIHISIT